MKKRPNEPIGQIRICVTAACVIASGLAISSDARGQLDNPSPSAEELAEQWSPWLGCWSLWQEQYQDPESLREAEEADAVYGGIVGRTSVCVTPTDSGVSLRATEGDRILVERTIVADGQRHEVDDDGCVGWEHNEWSRYGQRLFTRGELQCGDSPHRTVHGVSFLASASSWVDIQLVQHRQASGNGVREQLEVRRYTPMPDAETQRLIVGSGQRADFDLEAMDIGSARRRAAETLVMADVVEASEKSPARVVEALLVETRPNLHLDARNLIALDDAGIDHAVVDLLVALSYPERFVVERRAGGASAGGWLSGGYGGYGGAYDRIWYDDLYPYYVSPFGYRSYGRGGFYNPYVYGLGASPFVVLSGQDTGADIDVGTARAIRTRGYTRVRPREANSPQHVVRRGSGGGRTRSAAGGSSSGGGYRGGSSSSGGSRGGGGRTANPR